MLRSAKSLLGYKLHELDALVGEVHDLYFDDKRWDVRHLVAKLGGFWRGRKVLVAPSLLGKVDPVAQMLLVQQTAEQVRRDPESGADKPVYQQFQEQSREYYQWVAHWTPFSGAPEPRWEFVFTGDSHLRSVRHLIGYSLKAEGEAVGHLADFLVEDDGWHIPQIVVDTENEAGVKKVVLPVEQIQAFVWEERVITLGVDRVAIVNAPEYQPEHLGK